VLLVHEFRAFFKLDLLLQLRRVLFLRRLGFHPELLSTVVDVP
tara:strand:+ start:770 stop:898 length:129 start_codon:yes stop_codon:yes gene_type:complete